MMRVRGSGQPCSGTSAPETARSRSSPRRCRSRCFAARTPTVFLLFFFQAEDGIRDYKVTGVQTCALPISGKWVEVSGRPSDFGWGVKIKTTDNRTLKTGSVFGVDTVKLVRDTCASLGPSKIGRASCRERV